MSPTFDSELESSDVELTTPSPLLSPPEIHFEPHTNIKTITTWHISPSTTHKIRTIRTFRIPETRASKERILFHLTFEKFGRERGNKGGVDERTTSIGDDVPFFIGPDWREQSERMEGIDITGGVGKSVVCRICQGEHFTMKCNQSLLLPITPSTIENLPPTPEPTPKAKYIPPIRRGKPTTSTTLTESTCLRISNLSKQITEQEFTSRFSRFGKIIRAFLPKDFKTGEYRGYGYIHFFKRESAEKAIEILDRKGFDNLIMGVAWDERPISTSLVERMGKAKI